MPSVVLVRRARRELLALEWPVADAVEEALAQLEHDSIAGHALRGWLTGLRALRIGSFRVIYQIIDERTVRVLAILHRSVAYRTDPR